jgi:serine/threonine protein kinase/Tol biopolymer transport system component
MTDSRWQKAKTIFSEALEKPAAERQEFLDRTCGADAELRVQVDELLLAHTNAGEFLSSPMPTTGRIGPYKLLQVIGEGGFGVVYMAEQERPIRRRVALKVIKLGMDTKEVIARFEAERQALALMDHPNIAKVLDAGATETGRPYFVMELVKGVPITEYCDSNKLSTRERLQLFVDVCRGVNHAHQRGVIHRDIKPSNILVTLHDGTPVPKVIDFGIAKAMSQPLTERTLFTAYGEFVGTPWCMSPEQAALGGLEIDQRADVYALGVLLYELLTGTTPFEAEGVRSRAFLEIMRMIREDDPPTPSARITTLGKQLDQVANRRRIEPHALAKMLRGDLDWIVMKALEKDRRRRYDSAVDLADDVARFFKYEPVRARKPSTTYRATKFARRHRTQLVGAAVMLIAITAGGAVSQLGKARDEAPQLPVIEPKLTQVIGSDSLVIWKPALSPDRKWGAFSTFRQTFGPLQIVSAEGGEPRLITSSAATEPQWLPSGDRLAWLTDKGLIVFAAFDPERGVTIGEPKPATSEPALDSYRVSPDGRWLAYRVWADSGHMLIRVVPTTGGGSRTVVNAEARVWLMDWSADGRYIYYLAQILNRPGLRPVFRVAASGGTAVERMDSIPSGPDAPRVAKKLVVMSDGPIGGRPPIELQRYDGSAIARVSLPPRASIEPAGRTFSSDGKYFLATVSAALTPVKIVSLADYRTRQVGQSRSGDWPIGWSADGRDVFVATPLDQRYVIMRWSATGGGAHEVGPVPDRGPPRADNSAIVLSGDRRHIAYSRAINNGSARAFFVRSISGGEERMITDALHDYSTWALTGRGGTANTDGEEFLYMERRGDSVQLRAFRPDGEPRLLRTFAAGQRYLTRAVYGSRVAYSPGGGRLMISDGVNGREKQIASVPGVAVLESMAWSHDGKWLAVVAYVGKLAENKYSMKLLLVGVAPNGAVAVPARLIDLPIAYAAWSPQWSPDGSAVALTGQAPSDGRIGVWRVPVHEDAPAVMLTEKENGYVGYSFLSPDGTNLLYGAELPRGSSLWLAELPDDVTRRR